MDIFKIASSSVYLKYTEFVQTPKKIIDLLIFHLIIFRQKFHAQGTFLSYWSFFFFWSS